MVVKRVLMKLVRRYHLEYLCILLTFLLCGLFVQDEIQRRDRVVYKKSEILYFIDKVNLSVKETKHDINDLKVVNDKNKTFDEKETVPTENEETITPDSLEIENIDYFTLRKNKLWTFDHKLTISGNSICPKGTPVSLVILCLSEYYHIEERETIRATWGSVVKTHKWPAVQWRYGEIKLVFIFGSSNNTIAGEVIAQEESKKYNDIIQADFVDTYTNLTRKVLTGLKWVRDYCSQADYVLKVDEDTFVNLKNLMMVLEHVPKEGIMLGHLQNNASTFRRGRWGVSKEDYPFRAYPPYLSGNSYVISGNIVPKVVVAAQYLPFLHIEDAFFTGIIRKTIGAGIINVVGFTWWAEKTPRICSFHNHVKISATNTPAKLTLDIWKALSKKYKNCYERRRSLKRFPIFEEPEMDLAPVR